MGQNQIITLIEQIHADTSNFNSLYHKKKVLQLLESLKELMIANFNTKLYSKILLTVQIIKQIKVILATD